MKLALALTGWMLLAAASATPVCAQTLTDAPAPRSVVLRTYPEQVYFTTANAKEKLSASVVMLIVEEAEGESSTPLSLDLHYNKLDSLARSERLLAPVLESIEIPNFPPTRLHPPAVAKAVNWSHTYRLMLSMPAAAGIDSVEARLTLQGPGAVRTITAKIPVRSYEQKTSLIFPMRGPAIISQGGALESGHRNRSGLYALDALGLSPTYGPMRLPKPDDDPKNYSGWGREVISPASGTIVQARNNRPDQPIAGESNPAFFVPEFPDGGDPGNYVVIDHGNGEFSMIAHMQKGSVRVKRGDRVNQGQPIGLVGNSGDTSGPHVHYQLQNGPDWERADGLPPRFTNVSTTERGSYFNAR